MNGRRGLPAAVEQASHTHTHTHLTQNVPTTKPTQLTAPPHRLPLDDATMYFHPTPTRYYAFKIQRYSVRLEEVGWAVAQVWWVNKGLCVRGSRIVLAADIQ